MRRARTARSHAGRAVRGAVPRALRRRPADVHRRVVPARAAGGAGGAVVRGARRGPDGLRRRRSPSTSRRSWTRRSRSSRTRCWSAALVRAVGLARRGRVRGRAVRAPGQITRELDELEATRDALRPSAIAPRPALDLAAHYVPVQDGVGGDFYLAVEGPRGSTVLVVGDVVGKGVTAAQRAVFVRTSLVTFAPFEDDPARLLQLANAALIDRAGHVRGLRDGGLRRPSPGGRDARLGAGRPSRAARARLGPRARPRRRRPAARARPRPRCHRRDHPAHRGRRRAALHGRDPRRARRARRALRRGAAERAGRRVLRARPPRAWSSTCGSRSPTSRRPPATTSACSRRATTGRPIGGRRRRR